MNLLANLFEQPVHVIAQKSRIIPLTGFVRLSKRQNRTMPLNTAAQKAGMRYENQVEKQLLLIAMDYGCKLHSHIWFDVAGKSAQTDFFLTFPSKTAILFEVKQTWVDTSDQLAFYKYLLTGIDLHPVTCCTICKNLTPETPRADMINSFEDIKEGAIWTLRL